MTNVVKYDKLCLCKALVVKVSRGTIVEKGGCEMGFKTDNCAKCGRVVEGYKGVWYDDGFGAVIVCNACYGVICEDPPRSIDFEDWTNLEKGLDEFFSEFADNY